MIRKLIKHDILSTYRDFAGYYMGMLAFTILTSYLISIGDGSSMFSSISALMLMASVVAVFALTFITVIRLFSKRMFSNEGYLTLTLPTTHTQTVIAKLISSFFWITMTSLVFLIAISIILPPVFLTVGYTWAQFWQMINTGIQLILSSGVLVGIPLGILEIVYSLMILLSVIVFVNTCYVKNHKTTIGILVFLFINLILETIRNSYISAPITVDDASFQLFPDVGVIEQMWAALQGFRFEVNWVQYGFLALFYVLVIAGFGFLTVWLLNKKLELE